jgi:hypothetical protein
MEWGELLFVQTPFNHVILAYFYASAEVGQHFLAGVPEHSSQVFKGKIGDSTFVDSFIELHHILNFHLHLALSFPHPVCMKGQASLLDFEVGLVLIVDLESGEVHLQELIISIQQLMGILLGVGEVELRACNFGL